VTVCRPSASTDPTNSSRNLWNVRGVKAIENGDNSGSAALGSTTTGDIADSFPIA
jgi:hypothetical protein